MSGERPVVSCACSWPRVVEKGFAMIVRTLEDLEALGRIKYPADRSFRSARFLSAADGMGFSYNENKVAGGTNLVVWLKHHWEAN